MANNKPFMSPNGLYDARSSHLLITSEVEFKSINKNDANFCFVLLFYFILLRRKVKELGSHPTRTKVI